MYPPLKVSRTSLLMKEYYAKEGKSHGAAGGAGGGIVSMLEVVESDFTKGLGKFPQSVFTL